MAFLQGNSTKAQRWEGLGVAVGEGNRLEWEGWSQESRGERVYSDGGPAGSRLSEDFESKVSWKRDPPPKLFSGSTKSPDLQEAT